MADRFYTLRCACGLEQRRQGRPPSKCPQCKEPIDHVPVVISKIEGKTVTFVADQAEKPYDFDPDPETAA